MAETKSSLELVEETEQQTFAGLYARMDADAKLAELDPYTLANADGKKIPGGISVTMNDPGVFLNVVASWIMDAKWQTVVEGEISGKQQHVIESFLNDLEDEVEERLSATDYGSLFPFLASHICGRGWIGARRIWLTGEDGQPYLDVLPIDMRYCSYERSGNTFDWVGVRFLRSKAAIKREYGIDIHGPDSEIEVLDFWDAEKEEIWIDKNLVPSTEDRPMPNKHRLGYPPFVIVPAPEGFIFLDKGYVTRRGESVLFLNRGLYPEFNRIVSIDQSLALLALAPPYQKETAPNEPKVPYPNEPASTYELPNEHKYELVPQPDINTAGRTSHQVIAGAIQRGGVNNIDLGNLTSPTSAIWITEQTEIRSKIITPRLKAIADFKRLSARMDIDQFQKASFAGTIGRKGKRRQYEANQLGNPEDYSISYLGMSRSKKQEIANMALFNASAGLSLETRLREILMHEDPDGELARIQSERAEQGEPALFFFRKAYSLAEQAESLKGPEADRKKLESMMLTRKGVALLRGPPPTPGEAEVPREKDNSSLLLPLLGGMMRGDGGRGGAQEVVA